MSKHILFFSLVLVGCASQDTITEVQPRPAKSSDCGLAALVEPNPGESRTIGSCGGALEQLDDGAPKRRK